MRIYDVTINGREKPLGIDCSKLICSWKVDEAKSIFQKAVCIEVSLQPDFECICYCKQGSRLLNTGELLEMQAAPQTRYYVRVQVLGENGESAVSDTEYFESGLECWRAQWITTEKEDTYHPEFMKTFVLPHPIKKARLYISGLGLFEAYINGKKVGNDYLAPFNNDYTGGVQYCTYDVTELLEWENELSVILGNGWYKGRLGYTGQKAVYGDKFQVIAELHVEYGSGERRMISTDTSWKYRGSDIVESDIYDGEFIDELFWKEKANKWKSAVLMKNPYPVVERYSLPLIENEKLPVKELIYTPNGETVLDFGQNFAGYVIFTGKLKKGDLLKLSFGEILQEGNFYRENYRTAKAEFCYRSSGRQKTICPHFTYYGFRYVKVEGIEDVKADEFEGIVLYSKMKRTGYFKSSNAHLNRLYENTVWGLKSNFIDMPTDCPQRDERLGWTGDAQIFSGTASYHMDTRAFFEKYLRDLYIDQKKHNGQVAMYLPNLQPGLSCAVWGDAATMIPTVLYQHYGDKEALRQAYPLMKSWVDYIHAEDEKRGCRDLWDFGFQLGDWLALDGITEQSMLGATDVSFIASVYYYGSAEMTANAARILGFEDEAVKYAELAVRIRKAVLHLYYTPAGLLAIDTQTAYYVALALGLYRSKEALLEGLQKRIKKDCYQIKSGFAGAPLMCNVLADAGMTELAYDFLFNESYPGWMYEVKMGATTVWERWNSVLPDGKISGTGMNSLNHYAYGAVAEFLYRHVAGISPLTPGFKKVRIAPKLTSYLQWVDCTYDSAAGKYRIKWEIKEGAKAVLHVEVPFDAKAEIVLPDRDESIITVNAGVYDYTFDTIRDYQCMFTMNSRLEQLKENKEATAIAQRKCPALAGMLASADKEILSKNLEELLKSNFVAIPKEELKNAIKEILKIKTSIKEKTYVSDSSR